MNPETSHTHIEEEKQRIQELNEQGLCLDCGDNPQNHALPSGVCLDCFSASGVGCSINECPNSAIDEHLHSNYCKLHLIDALHHSYDVLKKNMAQYHEDRQEFDDKCADIRFDPTSDDSRSIESDRQHDIMCEWRVLMNGEAHLEWLEEEIRNTMKNHDHLFPENYPLKF